MSYIHAIIIAIVEGITEFLPISSTAHMKFTNPMIGVSNTPFVDMFEVVIQLAAILAVVVLYWKKFVDFKRVSFYIKLFIALIPALIIGALLKKYIDAVLDNLYVIASVMIAGGIVLLFIDSVFKSPEITEEENLSYKKSFIIGWFQTLSIIFPGLSRSAATIIGGMSQKLTRSLAAEFSFLLAVPTMFAASVKSFYDLYKEHPEVVNKTNMGTLGVGSVVSFIVSLIAVRFFIRYLQNHGFKMFGYYRIVVGVIMLVLLFLGVNLEIAG
ncbi:MAG TPA: undecaprenyl-diphosphate phosphatase [Bacteroidales bacterium]